MSWTKTLNAALKAHNKTAASGGKAVSFATQEARRDILEQGLKELRALSFKLSDIRGFKERHMAALGHAWEAKGLFVSTIQNRISIFRTFSERIGKTGMIRGAEHYVKDPKAENTGHSGRRWLDNATGIAVCISVCLGVPALLAVIVGAILLPPLTTLDIIGAFLLPSLCLAGCLTNCCVGIPSVALLISPIAISIVGSAVAALTAAVGPVICAISVAGLAVLAGLWCISNCISNCIQAQEPEAKAAREEEQQRQRQNQERKTNIEEFQRLAQSGVENSKPSLTLRVNFLNAAPMPMIASHHKS